MTELVPGGFVERVLAVTGAVLKPLELVGALAVAEDASGHDHVGPGQRGQAGGDLRRERGCWRRRILGFGRRDGSSGGGRCSRLGRRSPTVGRRGRDQRRSAVARAGGQGGGEENGGGCAMDRLLGANSRRANLARKWCGLEINGAGNWRRRRTVRRRWDGTQTRRCARPHIPILPRRHPPLGERWGCEWLHARVRRACQQAGAGLLRAGGRKLAPVLVAHLAGKGFERLAVPLACSPERGERMLLGNA